MRSCRVVLFARFAFQACSFNHSDISPFRLALPLGQSRSNRVNSLAEGGDPANAKTVTVTEGSVLLGASPCLVQRVERLSLRVLQVRRGGSDGHSP